MLLSRRLRNYLFWAGVVSVVPSLSAEIIETREYHGKKVECIFSGMSSTGGWICGTEGYARVFTGTVKSVTAISDTDRRLELIPEETFLGPATEVTATVNQACMPQNQAEIQAGDRWLFHLQSPWHPNQVAQGEQEEFVLPYGGRSGPLDSASVQEEVSTLRHLARLTETGVITGNVTRTVMEKQELKLVPVSDWALTAKSASTGLEYGALTDSNGHFEIEVPPGRYDVTANTQQGSWAPDRDPPVSKRQCVDVDFPMSTDGGLSGTVTAADGRPAANVQVAILRISPWDQTLIVRTDAQGHFEVRGQDPGRFIVGEGLLDTIRWRLRVYYPGVSSKEQAIPIDLGNGESRRDIDFKQLPSAK